MKVLLRTVTLENVIWADFRPLYRGLRLSFRVGKRSRSARLGRAVSSPQQIWNIRSQRLGQERERGILHVLGVARLSFTERGLRQRFRRTHRD